jgi:hypothetical protein
MRPDLSHQFQDWPYRVRDIPRLYLRVHRAEAHTIVPKDRHTHRRGSWDIRGRSSDKEHRLCWTSQPGQSHAIWLRLRLVVAGLFCSDNHRDGHSKICDGHTGQGDRGICRHGNRHLPQYGADHLRRFRPRCQFAPTLDEILGTGPRHTNCMRGLLDNAFVGPVGTSLIRQLQVSSSPVKADPF